MTHLWVLSIPVVYRGRYR